MDTRMGGFDGVSGNRSNSCHSPYEKQLYAFVTKKITTTDPLDGIEERCHGNGSGKGSQIP